MPRTFPYTSVYLLKLVVDSEFFAFRLWGRCVFDWKNNNIDSFE
ncbi:hypothetical protein [Tropheryma whipplei]|nr:hypothetical protein [Tropheryma whipplei]